MKRKFLKIGWLCILASTLACTAVLASCAPGNGAEYGLDAITPQNTALTGKTIYWLGSSVTLGMESGNVAVADYIAARNNAVCKKDAISGTTLRDTGRDSYLSRLRNSSVFDKTAKIDAFVCQISTNDAKSSVVPEWGNVSAASVRSGFDEDTTVGAMEAIVTYVEKTWDCPIYFYSGSWFGDSGSRSSRDPKGSDYGELVELTEKVIEKWNAVDGYELHLIDLFNDKQFNAITDEEYALYMHDAVHPYKAGYLKWWTPRFEEVFLEDLGN